MARSTTPPNDESVTSGLRIAVAYSGGRDSTAMLHATARMARELGHVQVIALHVHHGLSAHADAWLAHAMAQCEQWAAAGLPVSLISRHLHLKPNPGQSIEALARQQRYAALTDMALQAGVDAVWLAHHRQDQAETFLLQALRGAGVAGLASMPQEVQRHGVIWVRPWLHHSPEAVASYVAQHALEHIEDDSNADVRLARNRLRHQVWPVMQQAFEQAESSLSQAASHLADVLACQQQWLQEHLPSVLSDPAALRTDKPLEAAVYLDVAALKNYPPGPQRELLRAWFRLASGGHALPASWTLRLQLEAGHGPAQWPIQLMRDGYPHVQGRVLQYRGQLSWQSDPVDGQAVALISALPLCIEGEGILEVPEANGQLLVKPVSQGGVALHWLHACQLRSRQGGEHFQLAQGCPPRSLKKQFQSMGVPAWARQAPLLWAKDQLVYVPELGIDARVQAVLGEEQYSLTWMPA
jgi:tRNA(Ile)-lysidine synthase